MKVFFLPSATVQVYALYSESYTSLCVHTFLYNQTVVALQQGIDGFYIALCVILQAPYLTKEQHKRAKKVF